MFPAGGLLQLITEVGDRPAHRGGEGAAGILQLLSDLRILDCGRHRGCHLIPCGRQCAESLLDLALGRASLRSHAPVGVLELVTQLAELCFHLRPGVDLSV